MKSPHSADGPDGPGRKSPAAENFVRRILLRFGMQEPDDEFLDYYRMLGVEPTAAEDQIVTAIEVRNGLLEALDPLDPLRQRLASRLREAARVLLNRADRAVYDRGVARNLATAHDQHARLVAPLPDISSAVPKKAKKQREAGKPAPALWQRPALIAGAACAVLVVLAAVGLGAWALLGTPERATIAGSAPNREDARLIAEAPNVTPPAPKPPEPPPVTPAPLRQAEPPAPPKPNKGFKVVIPAKDKGSWRIANGCLEQTSLDQDVLIYFGDRAWSDYDFSVEFFKVRGNDQCALVFLVDEPKRQGCYYGLGSFDNTAHTIERWGNGKPLQVMLKGKGTVPLKTWQSARVSVRAARARCFLNDQEMFRCVLDTHSTGQVGLRTWGTLYRFRNIKVTDPTGKVLLEGLPDLPGS